MVSLHRAGSLFPTPNHTKLVTGKGIKGVWVKAVPELITSELQGWAKEVHVKPVNIPGYWYEKKGVPSEAGRKANPGEQVLLHLHGGAYVHLSAHEASPTHQIVLGLLKHLPAVNRYA